jgi:capsular polysaccharide biosynthesis protein
MSAPETPPRTPLERAGALLTTLRRRWIVALIVFVVAFTTTAVMLLGGERQYAASAQILLQRSDAVSQVLSPGVVPSPANAQRDIDTNTRLITSRPVLQQVSGRLGHTLSPTELARKIDVSGQDTSNLVSITARDPDPSRAARIATAAALAYERYRLATGRAAIDSAITAGRARLDELKNESASANEQRALRDRLVQLETSAAIGVDSAQLIRRALPPTQPESQHRMIAGFVSLLLAVTLAVAAAALVDLLDKRLRSPADLQDLIGAPVVSEAGIAATLAVSEPSDSTHVVLVTSIGPGDHRAGVVTRLAAQLTALGRSVRVVKASRLEVSGAPTVHETLHRARDTADFVLVRGPAATEAAALPLAAAADGILLVAELPGVTKDDAAALAAALGPMRGRLTGIVVCSPAPRPSVREYLHEHPAPAQAEPDAPSPNGDGAKPRRRTGTLTGNVAGGREQS